MVVVVGALLSSSCSEPRGVTSDQMDLVIWYVEDVAHGQPRNPQELRVTNPTPEMDRIASWLSAAGTNYQAPHKLSDRRERWPAIKSLIVQEHVVVLDDGLLGANPAFSRTEQVHAMKIIDAENHDRRTIDALIINLANFNRAEAETWIARMSNARVRLATQAGAKRWIGKYHKSALELP
jgi:hypothetical protein